MAGNPNAMNELRDLLAERAPLYAVADLAVDTSELGVAASVDCILAALPNGARARPQDARARSGA
jgi:hypothetical protein